MEAGLWPEVQWAAVSTSVGEMRLPPQKGREPELDNNNEIFAQVKVFTGLLSVKNILG